MSLWRTNCKQTAFLTKREAQTRSHRQKARALERENMIKGHTLIISSYFGWSAGAFLAAAFLAAALAGAAGLSAAAAAFAERGMVG